MKCHNKFASATFDAISVDQRPMPKESKTEWIIIGVVCGVLLILFGSAGCWWVTHHEKKTEKWKSEFMTERLEQIEEKEKIHRRNSEFNVNHHEDINEIRDMIAAHPDFADAVANSKGSKRAKSLYQSA